MEIQNQTPFKAMIAPHFDKNGSEVATVIVKGAFGLDRNRKPEPVASDKQVDIVMSDEYWGEPGQSPVKHESDLAIFKPTTDLIMMGCACDPKGKAIKEAEVSYYVGKYSKTVTVASQEKMEKIPLHYAERVNERGWLGSRKSPDGFGFFPKGASPRLKYAGTYDATWQKERFPFLPTDFDYRFFQSAYPGLISDVFLRGDEPVKAKNVSSNGPIATTLPRVSIKIEAVFEKRRDAGKANLDTVILEPEEQRLVLTWRRMVPIHGAPSSLKAVMVTMSPVA